MPLSTIGSNQITDGAIAVADVADGSITTAKIADGNITGTKLATNLDLSYSQTIRFGTDNDASITHDGSNLTIDSNTGITIYNAGQHFFKNQFGTEDHARFSSNGAVNLYHDNAEKIRTTSTGIQVFGSISSSVGALTLSDGNLVLASGHGIDFSANANASGRTSELLDDYEEGTWVPAYTSSGGSLPTISYQTQQGSYTKIGRLVVATFSLGTDGLSSIGSASGDLRLSGLPFTHATGSVARSISHLMGGRFASDTPAQSIVSVNTSFAVLRELFDTTTQANDLNVTGQSNRNVIEGHVIYYTD